MLLNVLDLEKATVEDIMIPRNDVIGIDIENSVQNILALIRTTEYTRLPVFEKDINNVVGELHLRDAARFIQGDESLITHEAIKAFLKEPYFVPESTPLSTQLINFQKAKRRLAMVVDEYGEVQGIATLVDLLEEIVGDFVTDSAEEEEQEIVKGKGNWYTIDASASVRDINKHLGWNLPTDGPKTLNGVILENLESIPDALFGFQIGRYRFEIEELSDTRIEKARVLERKTKPA
jgi:Mg2+/Co2+ transporter CorB